MLAYRQNLIVENPNQLVLKDLPFQPGQAVEVLLLVNAGISAPSAQDIAARRRAKKSGAERESKPDRS